MNRILQMAAAQGNDANFASGDFGDETARIGITAVDFPASSPFATGIHQPWAECGPYHGVPDRMGHQSYAASEPHLDTFVTGHSATDLRLPKWGWRWNER